MHFIAETDKSIGENDNLPFPPPHIKPVKGAMTYSGCILRKIMFLDSWHMD